MFNLREVRYRSGKNPGWEGKDGGLARGERRAPTRMLSTRRADVQRHKVHRQFQAMVSAIARSNIGDAAHLDERYPPKREKTLRCQAVCAHCR